MASDYSGPYYAMLRKEVFASAMRIADKEGLSAVTRDRLAIETKTSAGTVSGLWSMRDLYDAMWKSRKK